MSYLIDLDFNVRIQVAHLAQITSANPDILRDIKKIVIEDCNSWLVQKYDMARELTNTEEHDLTKVYTMPARVWSGTKIYYSKLPFPFFNYLSTYIVGAKVFWIDRVYTAKQAIPKNSPNPELAPDLWLADANATTIPANTALTNATKWIEGDNRSAQLVSNMIDICLYHAFSRVAPNNIPKMRVDRHNEAIEWLKAAGDGSITVNLPRLNPIQGARVRYGSAVQKNNNHY